ncbi:hypothetical protein LCGC14_2805690 [marine sediment metagenome]|uniref:Uncharacterized protein n=1 Tax=marine sediment metagenome TaxID=412755 RepID=A0A0F8YLD3_9ZZZZ
MNNSSMAFERFYDALNKESSEQRVEALKHLKGLIEDFKASEAEPPDKYFLDYSRLTKKHLSDTILYLESLNDLRSVMGEDS